MPWGPSVWHQFGALGSCGGPLVAHSEPTRPLGLLLGSCTAYLIPHPLVPVFAKKTLAFICSWSSHIGRSFSCACPKMVLGHNLQHMAPFAILTTASCMFFQGATLIFSALGPHLAPRTHILVQDPKSGSRLGLGEVLSNDGTPPKHDFALEMVPGLRTLGFPRPKWLVCHPEGLWASQLPPKPS